MTDKELIDAYRQTLHNYEVAKADNSNRVEAFVQFMSAETALLRHLGPDLHAKRALTTTEYGRPGKLPNAPSASEPSALRRPTTAAEPAAQPVH
jgi:hypothetical protein